MKKYIPGLPVLLIVLCQFQVFAQTIPPTLPDLSPGTKYNANIPTLKQVVGHDFGNEITSSEQIVRYLETLVASAPKRAKLMQYGRTWEGRPLYMIAISSPERMERLDEIKADLVRLADPRLITQEEADQLIQTLPVVSMFMHAVHGAEISPSGAALAEAYHLLAAENNEDVNLILKESIVLIDPSLNPDGRTRILSNNLEARARQPDPHPLSAEHDEPWPGGRVNHYLFDMNRDWFAQTQQESRARVQFIQSWMPHVMVDLHEMGSGEGTFFFPPPAPSDNPFVTAGQHEMFETIGRTIAGRFDARGFGYFTREGYRAGQMPNGGSSWPLAHGILGMLFEQATPISLIHRRQDGTLLTYRDGVLHHFTAAMATAETAARYRQKILANYYAYRRNAIAEGQSSRVKAYLIPPGMDSGQSKRLAFTLVRNGVDVLQATETIRHGRNEYPAGTYIVPSSQPSGRVARNLLSGGTTWNLPLLFDIPCVEIDRIPDVTSERLDIESNVITPALLPPAKVAYLMPWNATTAATVSEAMQAGIKVRAARDEMTMAGRRYTMGVAVIRTSDNNREMSRILSDIAARHGADVTALDSGFPDGGISLGSDRIKPLKAPRVLLGWDIPAFKYSAGWTRYILEQRYGQPATIVRINTMRRINFHDFDVVVLPSVAELYSRVLDESTIRRLKDWMHSGGTLITIGEASRWASLEDAGLLDIPVTLPMGQAEGYADAVSRSLLQLNINPHHWLSAGVDGPIHMLSSGRRVFTPSPESQVNIVGTYAEASTLVKGGNLPDNVQTSLASQPAVVHQIHGSGQIIAFLEEPNGFGYTEGTALLFINAVLLGPGHLR